MYTPAIGETGALGPCSLARAVFSVTSRDDVGHARTAEHGEESAMKRGALLLSIIFLITV